MDKAYILALFASGYSFTILSGLIVMFCCLCVNNNLDLFGVGLTMLAVFFLKVEAFLFAESAQHI